MAEIEVLRPGLYSTIQDMGRNGFQKFGVPESGVMDQYAAKMANLLLHNPANAAVLEITLIGPKLLFQGTSKMAFSGADLSPMINGKPISNNEVYEIKAGDELSFGKRNSGCRCYLAILGGFQTEEIMDSRSWYEEITSWVRLERGVKLFFNASEEEKVNKRASVKVETEYLTAAEVEAFPGPEYFLLQDKEKELLRNFRFSIGENYNRMAIQLKEELPNDLSPILTEPVLPGTVQLTPSGRLIILMRDCQTTGGYPRVLQVSEKGLNILAQKLKGDALKFSLRSH
ncbi:biotin-dependent carboxyltransferase family protein [Salinimicrobium sp. GXAS 041]|uniref:5-oxoprolinase subunit C family protein n=1 Tax=Salinimicrobium sp. GXAS 041 TaxID=3400806 RepID=UPI003C75260A